MNVPIKTVRTDSFSMDYFRFGHGAEPLVILPGLSVQSVMLFADSVAEAYQILSDKFTIYVFDRRKELPPSYSVSEMARDTVLAIEALGLDRINLFGASQGGMIAMEAAILSPALIRRLALGSTTSSVGDARFAAIEEWIRLAESGDKAGLYLAFGEAIYPKVTFDLSRDLLIEASKTVTDDDLMRFIVLAKGMKGFDVTDDLKKITCPVLVLGSKDDRVLGPAASVLIAENLSELPGHTLYMYDGYGHAAYDTAPDYRERLLRFFAS